MTRTNIFVQVLKDYMKQTTLHGYRYLTEPGRHWFERLLWSIVHIATTSCVLIIVYGMYEEYYNQLPVTTVKSIHHPIRDVPYPAIAICEINKLRKSKTLQLASQLYSEYNISVSEERFGELLRYLGLLFDQSEQVDTEIVVRELDEVLTGANITLNITQVMADVSTSCNELLIKCKWESQDFPCESLFQRRKTMEGFCCTFNYVRPTDDFRPELYLSGLWNVGRMLRQKEMEPPRTSPTAGPHMGLTVLVHTNLSDYYYPSIPVIGLKVLVFNPHDYPDTGSGGLTELLVTMKEEVFFSLSSVTTQATDQVHDLNIERRGCYFRSDIKEKFGDYYSYSDCMMDCRINSIRLMCGCLPFFSPERVTTRVCGIQDILCLLKYRDSWQTMRPPTHRDHVVESEGIHALTCANPCYPACTSTFYTVQASSMTLSQTLIDRSEVYPAVSVENHSIVHIYFGSPSTPLMSTDVLTTWSELLSNIGGVCGVFVGFSLMTVVEFIYYFTVRLAFECYDKHRLSKTVHPEEERKKHMDNRVEIGGDMKKPRVPNDGRNSHPKNRAFLEDRENRFRRNVWSRSASVKIFWNEINPPKNAANIHDLVY